MQDEMIERKREKEEENARGGGKKGRDSVGGGVCGAFDAQALCKIA